MMEQLSPSLWRLQDETQSTSYLVLGEERATMIDCGMGLLPVMPKIRSITQLPVDLLLTHAHPDHYGAADEFERVYLHERDAAVLPIMEDALRVLGARKFPMDRLHVFQDGAVFELGKHRLVAVDLPGHTPGSVVFVDDANCALFVGDAIGSGDVVLMAVPLAYDLRNYRQSLTAFLERSTPWKNFEWHGGHFHQAGQKGTTCYHPPCQQVVRDMIALCDGVLRGTVQSQEIEERFAKDGYALRAYLGKAGMVYTPNQTNA